MSYATFTSPYPVPEFKTVVDGMADITFFTAGVPSVDLDHRTAGFVCLVHEGQIKVAKPTSEIFRPHRDFIPARFKSSMAMALYFRAANAVLKWKSRR